MPVGPSSPPSTVNPEINLPLTLTADQTFGSGVGTLHYLLSGPVNLNGHALTVVGSPVGFETNPQNTISGPIAGTGTVTVTGGGALVLTGDSTFSGPTASARIYSRT